MRVARQRALHVVNSETINHAVLDDGLWLVSDPGKEFFLAGIRSIQVAVEHQAAAVAVSLPMGDDVSPSFFDFLPRDLEAHALPSGTHILRHLAFMPGRTGDVNDVAAHGDEGLFVDVGEDLFRQFGTQAVGGFTGCFQNGGPRLCRFYGVCV